MAIYSQQWLLNAMSGSRATAQVGLRHIREKPASTSHRQVSLCLGQIQTTNFGVVDPLPVSISMQAGRQAGELEQAEHAGRHLRTKHEILPECALHRRAMSLTLRAASKTCRAWSRVLSLIDCDPHVCRFHEVPRISRSAS